MLHAIHKRRAGQQARILHLVTKTEIIVQNNNLKYAFTDGHAVMELTEFFENVNSIDNVIDWDVMQSRYWSDTDDDLDRRRRRQAEFLVYKYLPWNLIVAIGVFNPSVKKEVCNILESKNASQKVIIRPDWYY
jgi:hypothetical protein